MMSELKLRHVYLEDHAVATPPEVFSSEKVEMLLAPAYERLGLLPGRLEMTTGIKERRLWPLGTLPSDCGLEAARQILDSKPGLREEIDLLIFASVCRDQLEPASSARVHAELKLRKECHFIDMSNACLGHIHASWLASQWIEAGHYRKVLVVCGENAAPLYHQTIKHLNENIQTRKELRKYWANFTLGSGGCAWLLSHEKHLSGQRPKVEGGVFRADTSQFHLCQGGGSPDALTMETDSEALMQAGLNLAEETWEQFLKSDLAFRPNVYLAHQVGKLHMHFLWERLKLKDPKTYSTFETNGNTGPVSLPLTLYHAVRKEKICSGDRILCLGIGSGLSCMLLGLSW